MRCAARRPRSSCETQLHKNKTFGHSAASYRLWLVRSHCSGSPLAWSGRRWPPVPECCWSSCTVGASEWRFRGWRPSSPRFLVRLSGSSRSQLRGLPMNDPRKARASVGSPKLDAIWEAPALIVAVRFWLGVAVQRVRRPQLYCSGTCIGRCLGLVLSGARDSSPIQQTTW